ncbi:C-type lectin domain family 2 member D-like [Tiliqua scincoides]|uniref:C-type lectin domain family 2 member D-like n=1 Tax=Tiliqua scincoides TaxID=71010 RepID=UPI003462D7EC
MVGPACPHNWVGFQGRCYYFSREEKNWTSSQSFCHSQQASLARIESEQKDFINLFKLKYTYWIGLRRKPGQPWKWLNEEKATLPVMGDGGDCAYLNDEVKASSSRCSTEHHWMCSKADALHNPK